jgi:hypothetical protein
MRERATKDSYQMHAEAMAISPTYRSHPCGGKHCLACQCTMAHRAWLGKLPVMGGKFELKHLYNCHTN